MDTTELGLLAVVWTLSYLVCLTTLQVGLLDGLCGIVLRMYGTPLGLARVVALLVKCPTIAH